MRTVSWGALLLLVAFLLAACSSATTAPADKALNSATVMEPTLKPLATLPQPVVAFTVEPTQPASSAALPAFTLATATAAPPKAGMQTEAKTAAQTSLGDEATLAATPEPTFTPPALPFTSDKDHYWLRRPIPEGGTVWTDKVYPYGSTRGGTLRPHHGVEFYVPGGTPILAAASGTVVVAGSDSETIYGPHPDFYGNLVVIELDSRYNGQPVYTLYGHLSQIFVNVGQSVNAEDILAYSGATGVADGAHLHFEVRVGQNSYNSTRNPLLWLYPFPEQGTVAGRVIWPDGEPVYEAPIILRRIDASSKYTATTTYAQGELNPDEGWQENFVLDDVVAGYYEVEVRQGEAKFTQEVWVFPYQTSFVEIVLQ